MIDDIDLYEVIHQDLVRQQYSAIKEKDSNLYDDGYDTRKAAYMKAGLVRLRNITSSASVDESLLDSCMKSAHSDHRLGFLHQLPISAAFGGAKGLATEESLFGETSTYVGELTTLFNVLCTLLDGLIDERNDLFEPERARFLSIFNVRAWEETDFAPPVIEIEQKHPIIGLTYLMSIDWVKRIRESRGWQSDRCLREIFARVVGTGFLAEIESSKQQFLFSDNIDTGTCQKIINKKSEYAVWIAGLCPICVNGWPPVIDQDQYRELMFAIGRYLGWIDDIRDIRSDIEACQWSNALLEIDDEIGYPSDTTLGTLQHALLSALAFDQTTAKLVKIGTRLYDEVIEHLESLDINWLPLLLMLADSTQAWFEIKE